MLPEVFPLLALPARGRSPGRRHHGIHRLAGREVSDRAGSSAALVGPQAIVCPRRFQHPDRGAEKIESGRVNSGSPKSSLPWRVRVVREKELCPKARPSLPIPRTPSALWSMASSSATSSPQQDKPRVGCSGVDRFPSTTHGRHSPAIVAAPAPPDNTYSVHTTPLTSNACAARMSSHTLSMKAPKNTRLVLASWYRGVASAPHLAGMVVHSVPSSVTTPRFVNVQVAQ